MQRYSLLVESANIDRIFSMYAKIMFDCLAKGAVTVYMGLKISYNTILYVTLALPKLLPFGKTKTPFTS